MNNRKFMKCVIYFVFFILVVFVIALSNTPTDKQGIMPTITPAETVSGTTSALSSPFPTSSPTPYSYLRDIDQLTWEYYKAVSLTSEFGSDDTTGLVKKWTQEIRVFVGEYATNEDWVIIRQHIEALNEIPGIPEIIFTENRLYANLQIFFVTQEEMNRITEGHNETALGYTTIWWDASANITQASIYIVYDLQTQAERQHTLLEEITQSLGIMNDSDLYADSIFYIHYAPDILALSPMDWTVLRIHYCDEIQAGMTGQEVEDLYLTLH